MTTAAVRMMAVLNSVPVCRDAGEERDRAIEALRVQLHVLTCSCVDMEVLLDAAGRRLDMTVQELADAVGIRRVRRGNEFVE